jgi:hypothetical protein
MNRFEFAVVPTASAETSLAPEPGPNLTAIPQSPSASEAS